MSNDNIFEVVAEIEKIIDMSDYDIEILLPNSYLAEVDARILLGYVGAYIHNKYEIISARASANTSEAERLITQRSQLVAVIFNIKKHNPDAVILMKKLAAIEANNNKKDTESKLNSIEMEK